MFVVMPMVVRMVVRMVVIVRSVGVFAVSTVVVGFVVVGFVIMRFVIMITVRPMYMWRRLGVLMIYLKRSRRDHQRNHFTFRPSFQIRLRF